MSIFLLLCLIVSVPFVASIYQGAIVEGLDHGFVVSLQTKQGDHFCCGSIITLKFILTAAACVNDRKPHDFDVIGGITKFNQTNGTRMLVDEVITANVYGMKGIFNNIALLYLTEEIPSSLDLHPIDLPNDEAVADNVNRSCRVYGWGKSDIRHLQIPIDLRTAVSSIGNQTKCRKHYLDKAESLLCIYDVNASLCTYDTGNPLVSDDGKYLWGISTEIHWCGEVKNESYYDIYTRVFSHMEWIQKNMNERSVSTRQQKQVIFTGIIGLLLTMLE